MKERSVYFKKYMKYIMIGIATGMANGLFGSGGGTIVVPAMILLLGVEEHKAHATAIAIILPLTLLSTTLYVSNSFVQWDIVGKVMIGGVLGGFIGAKLLHVCPTHILRKVFAVFMIFASIKMLI